MLQAEKKGVQGRAEGGCHTQGRAEGIRTGGLKGPRGPLAANLGPPPLNFVNIFTNIRPVTECHHTYIIKYRKLMTEISIISLKLVYR